MTLMCMLCLFVVVLVTRLSGYGQYKNVLTNLPESYIGLAR